MLELLDREPRYYELLDATNFGAAYSEVKAARRFDQAEELARRWRTRFPDDRKSSIALAQSLMGRFNRRLPALNRSRFDESIATLREAAELLAGNDAVLLDESVGELYRQSQADARLGELWDVLVSGEDHPAQLRFSIGTVLAVDGRFVEGRRRLQSAVDAAPTLGLAGTTSHSPSTGARPRKPTQRLLQPTWQFGYCPATGAHAILGQRFASGLGTRTARWKTSTY